MKQQTWLPVFSGFYNTFFDDSESIVEREIELSVDEYVDEYKEYYSELYKAGVTHDFFVNNLWEFIDFNDCYSGVSSYICDGLLNLSSAGIVTGIEFEKVCSPRYYNFSNDSINCIINYDVKKLKRYLNGNLKVFKEYIGCEYTSRDGFSSSYSNELECWLDDTSWHDHEVGSLLNFVYFNENKDAEIDLFYASNISEAFYNSTQLDIKGMIEAFNTKKGGVK